MNSDIKCSECQYCKDFRGCGNVRGSFSCTHPNHNYIEHYFKEHNIKKLAGFIGFGRRFENKPSIKSAPAWCPKKVTTIQ